MGYTPAIDTGEPRSYHLGVEQLDVSVSLLSHVVRSVTEAGHDGLSLLRSHGLADDILSNPDRRVRADVYLAIQNEAAAICSDTSFGFHLGQTTAPGSFSILGYLMMNCRTLGEALRMSDKYHRFMGTLFEWRTRFGLRTFTATATPKTPAVSRSRHCVESAFASTVRLIRTITGRNIGPDEVSFVAPPPDDPPEYRQFFGCPVRFRCETNAITLRLALAGTPIVAPNPALLAHFEEIAERMLAVLDESQPVARRVAALSAARENTPPPSLRDMSRELGMSARTLQYRLSAEGTSYSAVLEEVRDERAVQCLRDGLSVSEAAFYLGFADPASFSKYFKKRFGSPPSEYRSRLAVSGDTVNTAPTFPHGVAGASTAARSGRDTYAGE